MINNFCYCCGGAASSVKAANAGGESLLADVNDLGLRRLQVGFCPARRQRQGNVRTLFTLRLPSESGRCAAALFSQDALKGPLHELSRDGHGEQTYTAHSKQGLYIGEMTPVLALKTPRRAQNIDVASLQRKRMPSHGLG